MKIGARKNTWEKIQSPQPKIFRKIAALICALIGLFMTQTRATATETLIPNEYWVSPSTNTANLGTLSDPYDGSTELKFDGVMANLPANSTLHILAGTYQTAGSFGWRVKDGQQILGSGIDITTLHVTNGMNFPGNSWVIAGQFPDNKTNLTFSDFTTDTQGSTNVSGINVYGSRITMRRVKSVNSLSTGEVFPFAIWATNTSEGNIIEECEVSNINGPCSAIAVSGGLNGATNTSLSGVIRNNRVFLTTTNSGSCICQFGINACYSDNLLVDGNYVTGGNVGLYSDSGPNINMIVAHNTFKNVNTAIGFANYPMQNISCSFNTFEIASVASGNIAIINMSASFTNLVIAGNIFRIYNTYHAFEDVFAGGAGAGLTLVNNSMDSQFIIAISGITGVNLYNNVDLFGNPTTGYNQIEPPNSIARRSISGSASATVQYSDKYIGVLPVVGGTTLTLPSAAGYSGKEFIVADESGNAGSRTISISPQSGQTINGASSVSISTAYEAKTLTSDGANWFAR